MLRYRLGANVYAYRKYYDLSQSELSLKAKINIAQIGNIENQRISTGIDLIEKLATVFRVDPCLLLARPLLKMPGTGFKSHSIVPTFFNEGVAAYAF